MQIARVCWGLDHFVSADEPRRCDIQAKRVGRSLDQRIAAVNSGARRI
jgi:hypothetical protein